MEDGQHVYVRVLLMKLFSRRGTVQHYGDQVAAGSCLQSADEFIEFILRLLHFVFLRWILTNCLQRPRLRSFRRQILRIPPHRRTPPTCLQPPPLGPSPRPSAEEKPGEESRPRAPQNETRHY